MLIGIAGKTNTGKTTFFSASTMIDAEISNRVFTTIEPNTGIAFVKTQCVCRHFNVKCTPKNSKCVDGTRLVPIKLMDVAGLVPGAHLGKGMGNQFLGDIANADAIIHVVDISGSTDENGSPVLAGTADPKSDIEFFEEEIDYWILGIIQKGLGMKRIPAPLPDIISKQLTGLNISHEVVEKTIIKTGLTTSSDEYDFLDFARLLRELSKPMIIAANKIDIKEGADKYEALKNKYANMMPCSAETELALRKAEHAGLIKYIPGSSSFEIIGNISERQKKAFEFIGEMMKKHGSTGVQQILDKCVFDLLNMIVVYPVENEHKLSDKKGNVLPDAFLVKQGTTAHGLAYMIHEDIGKKFVSAIDAKTGRHVSANYVLKDGDVISVKSGR
ncbi:MAG: redox-regulated ATPase YchF [Candidatus Aenigmatarchaeota archaeon]